MKVKRFSNLWTMGLIIFGSLLFVFYLLKIIFPRFVVGVAEMPSVVKFGNFVDSHWLSYHIFNGVTSLIVMFFYCCACCRTKSLDIIEFSIIAISIVFSSIFSTFVPTFSLPYNFMGYIFLPLIFAAKRKIKDVSIFHSTCICFLITTLAQYFSLEIRSISTILQYPNTATYFIILIDAYIWNALMYFYFNFEKGENNNG